MGAKIPPKLPAQETAGKLLYRVASDQLASIDFVGDTRHIEDLVSLL